MTLPKLPLKRPLEDGLPQPLRPREVGRQRRVEFLHHRQPPFHFRHDAALFGKVQQRKLDPQEPSSTQVSDICCDVRFFRKPSRV